MVKAIAVLLLIAVIALAFEPDEYPYPSGRLPSESTVGITITTINTWSIDCPRPMDVDCSVVIDEIYVTDPVLDSVLIFDYDMNLLRRIVAPALQIRGIFLDPGDLPYVTDPDLSTFYMYEDYSWHPAYTNPVTHARGVDLDPLGFIWMFNSSTVLYRVTPPGVILDQWNLPEPPFSPDVESFGCTVFEVDGYLVVMVGIYEVPYTLESKFYFYRWDGSSLDYIGNHPTPETCYENLGVDYCSRTGTFFWVYLQSASYSMCEFECTITAVALDRTTWGAIKAVM